MKFINTSKNTVYLDDIDRDIPFLEDMSPQFISLQDAKKSAGFRKLVKLNYFEITQHNNSLFERNLVKTQKKGKEMLKLIPKEKKNEITQKDKTETSKDQIEVRLRGNFYELGGYAKVNRNLAFMLHNSGCKVHIDPVNKKSNQLCEDELRALSQINSEVSKNAIVIESVIPTFSDAVCGKYRILYTTIEAYTVPQQFLEIARTYREIWVTSDFCKKVLEDHNLDRPIYVVPDSIDTDLYTAEHNEYEFKPKLNDFVFLSVFGWSYRKGYDTLLKAYLSEFSGDDDVSLLIVSRNHLGMGKDEVIKETIEKFINEYGGDNPPHIARCSKMIPESMMPSIYAACDAFVLFSRGEGFGLPFCESSLCGLPVIASDCSGQSMFLKKNNSCLIDVDEIAEMQAGRMQVHYWDGQKFPMLNSEKTIEQAKKAMRYVYYNYDAASDKNDILRDYIADNYSMKAVAKVVNARLSEIWRKIS
jgi:glycosyltransferase involved in cell wall biosynthesis